MGLFEMADEVQSDKYTRSDRMIMEFIEEHTEEFLFLSIGQLSEQLSISEATISRFARHMGYCDYKEMKSKIAEKFSGKGPARKIAGTLMQQFSAEGFDVNSWFALQEEYLAQTMEHLDLQEFCRGVDSVQKANKVYIHAKNASMAAAQLLYFRLRRFGIEVTMIPSGGSEVIEGIAHAGKGDLVILFCYAKVSREGKMILDYAKEAGYQTLAFTSRLFAPSEERADINLYVYRGEKAQYHSMTSAITLIDALVLALSERMSAESAQKLVTIEKLKKKYSHSLS